MVRWCWVNFYQRGVLLLWIPVGQGPTALTVGAGGGCLDVFSLVYHFSFLSPSIWETARYRLKYCLKGPLSPKQPTNQPTFWETTRYRLKYCLKGPLNPTNQPLLYIMKYCLKSLLTNSNWGWSGGAMVLGKLPVPGRPTIWITVGQGPTVLAVGAGGGCLDIFTLIYPFFPLCPSLWETARYRLKYCLKGPLNPNQPTNQPTN